MTIRYTLPLFAALALTACGSEKEGGSGSGLAPGFELAAAAELDAREALGQTGSDIAEANAALIELDVEQLQARQATGNLRLIDVRRDDEVAQGIIPGAEHIPLDQFDPAKLDLSDGREIVLYCRSGRRSALAGEALAAHTGETAQHLAGGILAWQEAGDSLASLSE